MGIQQICGLLLQYSRFLAVEAEDPKYRQEGIAVFTMINL
jgi:hypothetical protein